MTRSSNYQITNGVQIMPKFSYKADSLEAALQDVRNGMTKKAAAKKHGVPRSTIQFRLSDKFSKTQLGPPPVLTKEEEDTLEKWINDCCRKGFPRRKEDLQLSVQEFLIQNERPNPFKNNLPGLGWYQAFLKRHPNLSLRTPEGVTSASSCVSENDIKNWFKTIEDILKEENAVDVLKDPTRVFNGDETNFLLCPKGSKVLAPTGSKNVYEIDKGNSKAAITVMFSFSACGRIVPPMLIYPYHRLPSTIVNSVPDSWGIGHSNTGWMKSEVFYEYIGNVFNAHLEKNNITRPVILFVDGHKSHLSYQLSQLCSELQIILIALYPNATRIMQPADVAAFRPIKSGWKKAVFNWRSNHPTDALTKENVAPILKHVVDEVKPQTLTNGFRACGLFPWNCNSIDYTKCLGKTQMKIVPLSGKDVVTLDQFEGIVGDEMIEKFRNIEKVVSENNEPPLFFTLYRVWEEFSRNKQPQKFGSPHAVMELNPHSPKTVTDVCVPDRPIVKDATQLMLQKQQNYDPEINLPAPDVSANALKNDTTYLQQSKCETMYNNVNVKLDHNYTTPEKKLSEGSRVALHASQGIAQASGSSGPALADVLVWPETPTRKGKRKTERVPYVVSSKKWKIIYEEKEEKKAKEERAKAERKRLREEKKLSKAQKGNSTKQHSKISVKKKNYEDQLCGKVKVEKSIDVDNGPSVSHKPKFVGKKLFPVTKNGLCYSCGTNFKDEEVSQPVECDMCDRLYHIKCIQNREDLDQHDPVFVCNICLDFGNEIANELNI